MDEGKTTPTPAPDATAPYEAPRVEAILTGGDLEREGQYAGVSFG